MKWVSIISPRPLSTILAHNKSDWCVNWSQAQDRQRLFIRPREWRRRKVEQSECVFVLLTCLDAFGFRIMLLFNRLLQQNRNAAPTRLTLSLDKPCFAAGRAAHARFLVCWCKCRDIADSLITRITAGVETARDEREDIVGGEGARMRHVTGRAQERRRAL